MTNVQNSVKISGFGVWKMGTGCGPGYIDTMLKAIYTLGKPS